MIFKSISGGVMITINAYFWLSVNWFGKLSAPYESELYYAGIKMNKLTITSGFHVDVTLALTITFRTTGFPQVQYIYIRMACNQ